MSNNRLFENVCLGYWHGGRFKHVGNGELVYMGGKGRTFQVAVDEICYWELVHFGKKCGDYSNIAGLFYLVPEMSLADGLRKISGDAEVLNMGEIVMKHRSVDVYVLHSLEEPHLSRENPTPSVSHSSPEHISSPISENIPPPKPTKPKKLTPKKGPQSLKFGPSRRSPRKHMESNVTTSASLAGPTLTKVVGSKASTSAHADNNTLTQPSTTTNPISNLETAQQTLNQEPAVPSHVCGENTYSFPEYEWEDNRPESPLTFKELCGYSTESEDESDPEFVPDEGIDVEVEVEDDYFEVDEGLDRVNLVTGESDNSDEEVELARQRVTNCNNQILEIASQLQREACEGRFGGPKKPEGKPESAAETSGAGGYVSEYENSEYEIHTPENSDDENACARRKGRRGMLVSGETDFSTFTWVIGQRFAKDVYLRVYGGSIPPCEGERHWPKVPCSLDPPAIKIGPGRPRKNRIKDPYENPKKPGSLSRTGLEMTCSLCKVRGHNKRRCPDKVNYVHQEPAAKRGRGRPRKDGSAATSSNQQVIDPTYASASSAGVQHHSTTAQPTHLGRGGRVIYSGRGARGGAVTQSGAARGANAGPSVRGTGGGRGRGSGKGHVPIGVGVIFSDDGTLVLQAPSTRNKARNQELHISTQSSQTSTVHQQHP